MEDYKLVALPRLAVEKMFLFVSNSEFGFILARQMSSRMVSDGIFIIFSFRVNDENRYLSASSIGDPEGILLLPFSNN